MRTKSISRVLSHRHDRCPSIVRWTPDCGYFQTHNARSCSQWNQLVRSAPSSTNPDSWFHSLAYKVLALLPKTRASLTRINWITVVQRKEHTVTKLSLKFPYHFPHYLFRFPCFRLYLIHSFIHYFHFYIRVVLFLIFISSLFLFLLPIWQRVDASFRKYITFFLTNFFLFSNLSFSLTSFSIPFTICDFHCFLL